jgi:hypothetical protein
MISNLSLLSLHLFATTLFAVAVLGTSMSVAAEDSEWVFELRTYTTNEGKLDALHARFRDHTIKLFEKHGMKNIAYWVPEDQPNTLVYLIAHPSVEARGKAFKDFVADPEWKAAYAASRKDGALVAKVDSQMLVATDYSPASTPEKLAEAKPGLIYELRTYTTNEGKLPNLNARFRDHTIRIFEKHEITNVLYTTPLKADLKDKTLVYFIAHKDREAANQSWAAFGKDADWKKVAAESQKDGKILVKGGVKRQYLTLTDYSPVK